MTPRFRWELGGILLPLAIDADGCGFGLLGHVRLDQTGLYAEFDWLSIP